jgi:hypothetical protein
MRRQFIMMPGAGRKQTRGGLIRVSTPSWYPRVARHPDYNGDRIILVDTNVFSDMALREKWDEEVSFVVNCPATELRIKLNQQIFNETLGLHAQSRMNPGEYQRRRTFIEIYRRNGKILIDDGNVPYFAIDRTNIYTAVAAEFTRFQGTGGFTNIEDVPIVVDAIVNRIPLLTGDQRLVKALGRALLDNAVRSVLMAHRLWTLPNEILLR